MLVREQLKKPNTLIRSVNFLRKGICMVQRFMTKLVLWYKNKNNNKIASTSNTYILITVKALDFLF